jgi:hypothetical protein
VAGLHAAVVESRCSVEAAMGQMLLTRHLLLCKGRSRGVTS